MHDVLREIVLAIGDEDLLALKAPGFAIAPRAGADGAEIRAGLRLGQAHRSGPFAAHQLRQVARAQLLRRIAGDEFRRCLIQQRAQGKGSVRAMPERHWPRPGQSRLHSRIGTLQKFRNS